ncbi:TonB-dependent receptor [Caulobacter sp. 73W]|uniref:TonB-dependent receptor n=1 Tax=Caulobacter sp. 73W TaxID=3161137 RepID=A0AB39KXX0_9CAUL
MFDAPPTVDAVVVTAPRLPDAPAAAVFSSVQVDPRLLDARPRVDEALKSAPGASLFRRQGSAIANPTTQGLSLRSIAPSGAGRALVTLDGAPLNDPFGGWVIWSQVQPSTLGAAQIVRGAGAGPYGAGALTGVVRLQTADGTQDDLQLELSGGGQGYGRAAVMARGADRRLLVSGAYERFDGQTPVRGPRRGSADVPIGLESTGLSAAFGDQIGDVAVGVRVAGWREKRGAGLVGADSVASGKSLAATAARQAQEGRPGWRLQAWAVESDLRNGSVATAADRNSTTAANDQYATPAQGYGLNAALRGSWWEIGIDGRLFEGESRERFRNMGGAFTRTRLAGGQASVAGLYGEAWRENGPLLMTAGVRLDRWSSSDARRQERDIQTGAMTLDEHPADRDGVTPTGRAGLRYAVSDRLHLRAAAYSGFRPATLNELHRPFRVGNDITEANAGLEPERLFGGELGVGGDLAGLTWSLSAFATRLEDAIANVTIGAGPGTFPVAGFVPAGGVLRQRQNVGHIEASGMEIEASKDFGDDLRLRAALSGTDAEVNGAAAAPQLTGKRPAQAPRWTVTAGGEWRMNTVLTASLDLRYESARWEDDLNTRRLSSALTTDVRLDADLGRHARLFVAADNLFDAKVETVESADGLESFAPGRLVRVGMVLKR